MHPTTVRVKNPDPSVDGFITVNVSDVRYDHEIWHTQASGFEWSSLSKPVERLDPALRDLAANLMLRICSLKAVYEGKPFDSLTDEKKVERLHEIGKDLDEQAESLAESLYSRSDQTQDTTGVDEGTRPETPGTQNGQSTSQEPGQSESNLRVEASRGYYYVWDGEEKVSKGFRDFDDAKLERDRLSAES